jgi:hypothetical protein
MKRHSEMLERTFAQTLQSGATGRAFLRLRKALKMHAGRISLT